MKTLIRFCGITVIIGLLVSTGAFGIVHTSQSTTAKEKEHLLSTQLTTVTMTFSPPFISEKKEYININIAEGQKTRSAGTPILPVVSKTLVFPLGTRIFDVSHTTSHIQTFSLPAKIIPAPTPITLDGNTTSSIREGPVYQQTVGYPPAWLAWRVNGGLRDKKPVTFLTLTAYPVQYLPQEYQARYISNLTVTVTYEKPETCSQADDYSLLIISPATYKLPLNRLVEHKESLGINTLWVTLNDIYTGTYFSAEGRDEPELIKYFIRNAVEEWGIDHVLLVGGIDHLPARITYTAPGGEESFLSDLYYADLYDGEGHFATWDSNENGYYGEYNHTTGGVVYNDHMDLYPDVYLGRLACRNIIETFIVVNKIIVYESSLSDNWFNRMIVVGGDSFDDSPWGTDYYEGEITVNKSLDYMPEVTPVKILGSNGQLSTENIIAELSEGAGFVNFEGHGNYLSWATHPPHDYSTWVGITTQDIPKIRNGAKLPIIVLGGCHIAEMGLYYECFTWRMVRAINRGAIAATGFTSLSWGADDDVNGNGHPDIIEYASGYLDTLVFKQYGQNDVTILGQVCSDAIAEYLNTAPVEWNNIFLDVWDAKTVASWVLLGDPSLQIGGAY